MADAKKAELMTKDSECPLKGRMGQCSAENECFHKKDAPVEENVMLMGALNPIVMEKQLAQEQKRRGLVKSYISSNLVEGVDYGTIHVAPKDKCPNPSSCKNDWHYSKPCLFKAGAEKFCSLLQLRARFKIDEEILRMTGEQGLIAFICELVYVNGEVVAEGRGACSLKEKMGNANVAIKIAEKRAKVDAVLSLGLSDTFTQEDVEDMGTDHSEEPKTVPVANLDRVYEMIDNARDNGILDEIEKKFDASPLYTEEQKKEGKLKITARRNQLTPQ